MISRFNQYTAMTKITTYRELEQMVLELERDLVSLNNTNRALSETEERYRILFEKSKDAILIIKNRI